MRGSLQGIAHVDWTRNAFTRDVRAGEKSLPAGMTSLSEFETWVAARVPWQAAIEAIANTYKHADYRDKGWENGIAMLASFAPMPLQADKDACKDGLELFAFMHQHKLEVWWDIALWQHPSPDAEPGYNAFGDSLDQWGELLKELGYGEI